MNNKITDMAMHIFHQQLVADFFSPRPQDDVYLVDGNGEFLVDGEGSYLISEER